MAINKRFNAAVEEVLELYYNNDCAGLESKLAELDERSPETAKRVRQEIGDIIAEQYYLDEGEEQGLW